MINKTSKKSGVGRKVVIGVGVGLAAAAAAYFLTGKRGEKNRAAIKDWAVKANEELARTVKKLEKVTKSEYEEIVSTIAEKYKHLDKSEFESLVKMLKSHWREFSKRK